MLRFHPDGKNVCIMFGSSFTVNSIPQAGRFFTPLDPDGNDTEEKYDDLTKPKKYTTRTGGRFLRTQSVWPFWKKHKIKDYNSGRPDLTPSCFCDSVPADCITAGSCFKHSSYRCLNVRFFVNFWSFCANVHAGVSR